MNPDIQNKDQFAEADKRFPPVARSKTFNRILNILNLRQKKVLDLGCGFGEYLVNFGPQSVGITSTPFEVEYGKSRNISIIKGNVEFIDQINLPEQFEAIWANNLFEHLLSPHAFLMNLKTVAKNDALIILGVPVIPKIASLLKLKKFRGALASPHINFFSRESLALSVRFAGWNIIHKRPFIFSNSFLDNIAALFAPHIYIVAKNDPSFSYPPKKIKEWEADPHYKKLLEIGTINS